MTLAAEFPADRLPDDRAQAIRDRLRDAIIERRLTPGAKLSEAEVGTLFDVSRTIARSALQMLTFEGLVRTERNRGAFVANPSPEEARQVFASRRLIEPGIATTACETIDAFRIDEFRAQLDREALHIAARGPDARRAEIKASGDFHLLLAIVAGNQILLRFMEELVARSSLVIALYGRSGASACGHSEHREIVDALEARDVTKTTVLIVKHIDHIEEDLELEARPTQTLREIFSNS
ncbi:GntR family transcriptional regulator [Mesorhizobium sp. CN2-181]|uniref:GntR family transcriptional regulator n=1 Tax=Mesorhizobium yinganensis TaxID=3157707 RepID=UPI0032B7EE49